MFVAIASTWPSTHHCMDKTIAKDSKTIASTSTKLRQMIAAPEHGLPSDTPQVAKFLSNRCTSNNG